MYYATYHGLHEWYKHCFTHLGWMILAKDNGYSTKVKAYLDGLKHLHHALNESIKKTKSPDRVRDLKMLLHNTKILETHASKILGKSKRRSTRRKSRK